MSSVVELRAVTKPRGLVGGPFGSSLVGKDYRSDGVPVIRGGNMGPGQWVGGEFAFVSHEKFRTDLARNSAEPGDLVFTQRGTLGQVAIVPPEPFRTYVVSQSQMRLRVDETRFDRRFVFYACTSPQFRKQIGDHAISTGVPHINLGILSGLKIPSFDLPEQRGIAEVLGALDNKIAANATLTATSLELADAIFQRTADGLAFGSTTFEDVASIQGGGTPSTKVEEYWGGEVWWATPTDVTNLGAPYLERTGRTITQTGFEACPSALHPVGSIFMTSRATIGAFAIAQAPAAANQGFIVVNAQDPSLQWWLFHEMRSRIPEFLSHANGATFLELSRGRFKKLPVRCPDDAPSFQAEVSPIHRRARAAAVEAEYLANTRDLLLPQLMSGKIRVKDAEHVVEGVV